MKGSIISVATAIFFTIVMVRGFSCAATPQPDAGARQSVVMLETEGSAGVSVRMAQELARILNDGSRRRILPVVGIGSLQNIMDLRLLRGIDVAIVQRDVLDYAKQRNLAPHIESWMSYITTLYNEEFHLIARPKSRAFQTSLIRK